MHGEMMMMCGNGGTPRSILTERTRRHRDHELLKRSYRTEPERRISVRPEHKP